MLAMKKLILILAVVAFATTAWAQETPKKPSFAGFVSNGFWDNWEMSLGGGVGTALTNGSNSGSFGKRLGFEANFSLVKWVHPVVGMRLQLQGGQFANYDADLGKLKWPYLFVHSDFMLNFSNWAGGYRDDRAYYLVPFVGFGYLATNFTDKSQEDNMTGTHQAFAFSYGLLNKFRLSRSFDFNIELKGMLAPSRVCPAKTDGLRGRNGRKVSGVQRLPPQFRQVAGRERIRYVETGDHLGCRAERVGGGFALPRRHGQ